ncbi:hypothetical protein PybrP1_001042 [[Pythium] brassicae (nom. inval.)]|nr:hypothetical protein PybrP1_001042 [[Pythium] brassicae (nom. inval.)]
MKNLRAAALALVIALATSAVKAGATQVHVRVHAAGAATAGNATAEPSWTLPVPVDGGLAVGRWTNLESNNYSIADPCKPQEWTVKQAKAAALQLYFASIDLAGRKLIVSAPNGSFAQEFSSESALHDVTTKTIPGSAAKISFQPSVPSRGAAGVAVAGSCDLTLMRPSFTLDKVLVLWSEEMKVKKEAVCGKNTVKNPMCLGGDMYAKSKAVLQLTRTRPDGKLGSCTAWLWGKTGLILTNNHCIQDGSQAANVTLTFQRDIECNADCTFQTCTVTAVLFGVFGEVKLLKTDPVYDYTVLMITNKQKAADIVKQYGYLKLQRSPAKMGDQIYIPQHPNGNAKKIASTDDDSGTSIAKITATDASLKSGTATFYNLIKYSADTDHGSSGSPVISRKTNAVVGLHRLGDGCGNAATSADTLIDELDMYLPGIDGIQE